MSRPISVARFERKLRAIAGVLGSNIVPDLDSLIGLIVLESERPEWELAGGVGLWSAMIDQAIVAGQFGFVALVNRDNTNMLLVVQEAVSTSPFFLTRFQSQTIPGFVQGSQDGAWNRDFRAPFGQVSVGRLDQGSNVVPIGPPTRNGLVGRASGSGYAEYLHPVIVTPGSSLVMETTLAATALRANFVWREVPLEGGLLG